MNKDLMFLRKAAFGFAEKKVIHDENNKPVDFIFLFRPETWLFFSMSSLRLVNRCVSIQ